MCLYALVKANRYACCATFIVSRERVLAHPKEAYQHLYDWMAGQLVRACVSSCMWCSMACVYTSICRRITCTLILFLILTSQQMCPAAWRCHGLGFVFMLSRIPSHWHIALAHTHTQYHTLSYTQIFGEPWDYEGPDFTRLCPTNPKVAVA